MMHIIIIQRYRGDRAGGNVSDLNVKYAHRNNIVYYIMYSLSNKLKNVDDAVNDYDIRFYIVSWVTHII